MPACLDWVQPLSGRKATTPKTRSLGGAAAPGAAARPAGAAVGCCCCSGAATAAATGCCGAEPESTGEDSSRLGAMTAARPAARGSASSGACWRRCVRGSKLSRLGAGASSTCGATARGTRYVRHTRGWYAYGVHTVAQQLPCASGTYANQEAGTRSLYVQYGGSGAYGSAQSSTSSGGSSHST